MRSCWTPPAAARAPSQSWSSATEAGWSAWSGCAWTGGSRAASIPPTCPRRPYLALRGKFPRYGAGPRLPFFLWLWLEVGQKLVDARRFHLGTKMRDAGQEVPLHGGPLPEVTSLSVAEHLLAS
jgi:hypothetical protein